MAQVTNRADISKKLVSDYTELAAVLREAIKTNNLNKEIRAKNAKEILSIKKEIEDLKVLKKDLDSTKYLGDVRNVESKIKEKSRELTADKKQFKKDNKFVNEETKRVEERKKELIKSIKTAIAFEVKGYPVYKKYSHNIKLRNGATIASGAAVFGFSAIQTHIFGDLSWFVAAPSAIALSIAIPLAVRMQFETSKIRYKLNDFKKIYDKLMQQE